MCFVRINIKRYICVNLESIEAKIDTSDHERIDTRSRHCLILYLNLVNLMLGNHKIDLSLNYQKRRLKIL